MKLRHSPSKPEVAVPFSLDPLSGVKGIDKTFVQNNLKLKESTLLLTIFFFKQTKYLNVMFIPGGTEASLLLTDWSLLHVIECGK